MTRKTSQFKEAQIGPGLTNPAKANIITSIRGSRRQVADIKSEPWPASNRNWWPASYWNAWPASSESADQKRRVCARRDLRGDLGQVKVHRLGVASRHDERSSLTVLGTDRAEDIGRGGSLVFGRARARAALGPTPGDLVLLADARLVREPYLYGAGIDALLARDFVQAPGETFLKSSMAPAACA